MRTTFSYRHQLRNQRRLSRSQTLGPARKSAGRLGTSLPIFYAIDLTVGTIGRIGRKGTLRALPGRKGARLGTNGERMWEAILVEKFRPRRSPGYLPASRVDKRSSLSSCPCPKTMKSGASSMAKYLVAHLYSGIRDPKSVWISRSPNCRAALRSQSPSRNNLAKRSFNRAWLSILFTENAKQR